MRGTVQVNLVSATESTVKVAGSRELRLAVIDGSKATTSLDLTHAGVATSLGEAVRVQAAFSPSNGIFDAVLVLTGTLPRALMTREATRLNATLGDGKAEKKVYLVLNNGDQALAKILAVSFPQSMSEAGFLDAIDGVAIGIGGAHQGSKLASTP